MRRGLMALGLAAAAAAGASAEDAPTTVAAAKENIAFTVDVSGSFDAVSPVEAVVRLQYYGDDLEIETCATGGRVEKGAVLASFKTEKIDEAILGAERDLGVAKATLAAQTEDQKRQVETNAATMAKVEFEAKAAQRALDRFEKTDKALRIEESAHSIEGTRNWLSDQTEEMKQLEKMYKGDDLVEETEEIVLTRARRDLERVKKSLEFGLRHDGLLRESDLPHELEALQVEARRAVAERDRLVAVTKLQTEQSRLELARTAANVDQQDKQLAKLKADREKFTLVAPAAGIAVPGALARGKWQNIDDVKRSLKPHGKFHSGDVVFTIVRAGDVRAVATIPESSLFAVKTGQSAHVIPNAAGDTTLSAKVQSLSPVSGGSDFEVALDIAQADERLMPGYGCKIRIVTGTRSAVMVPSGAVEDGFEKNVYVLVDGKPQKRAVKTGATKDDRVEILSGVAEGERVLETPPKR